MKQQSNQPRIRSTTVLLVHRNDEIAMAGDGQVTLGETVMKGNARKIRRIYNDTVLAGFAGATADAFALLSKFEGKLEQYKGQLERASIELTKEWRTDKYLRHLEALLIVADKTDAFLISGKGDVIASDAMASARALMKHTELSAKEIAMESLKIAGEICIYTNTNIILEEL
jgi:ATP-dependent HslUV protease, peptidase subunit HslV